MRNKNDQPKINYEPEADVLTYEITNQSIDYAKEIGNIVVHFTKSNIPVLIEILEATRFLKRAKELTSQTAHLSLSGTR